MNVELLFVLAFILVGGYRVYVSRADKTMALAWALAAFGGMAFPLSKLLPVGRLPIVVVGGICIAVSAVLFALKRKPEANEGQIPRG